MIAVYRDGYGYIDTAAGMTISGLEDEYRIAEMYGIRSLIYVNRNDSGRDPRLAALIERARTTHVFYFYDSPSELFTRVKDDLTAEITQGYLAAETQSGVLADSASELLRRRRGRQGVEVRRPQLIDDLIESLRAANLVCVFGQRGIGKTTLLAQFAEQSNALFARLSGLPPKEIFGALANLLRPKPVERGYATLAGARLAMSSAWAEVDGVVLVLDECEYIADVLLALGDGGGPTPAKQIVFSASACPDGVLGLQVPTLSFEEIQTMSGDLSGSLDLELSTPLAVQKAIAKTELLGVSSPPQAQEILCYLAISPTPLRADELLSLLGQDQLSVESLYRYVASLGRNVEDSPRGFILLHDDTGREVLNGLRTTPQKLHFYSRRLIELFVRRGDIRLAYLVESGAGDESESRYAYGALRQAAMLGDWRLGTSIARKLLDRAVDAERKGEALSLMLQLVYPMELMGEAARASELLSEAKSLAVMLGGDAEATHQEVALASRARRALIEADVEALASVRNGYKASGDNWDAGRIGLELSAIRIAAKDYEGAIALLADVRDEFEEAQDEYGRDLAERNLASALSGLPGRSAEADVLIAALEERAAGNSDTRRQRAWTCNLLTRRFRDAGRLDDARAVALEAISLAEALGDQSLRALNCINLGNVEADVPAVSAALSAYNEGGASAQRCGRRDVEADASRLRAKVLNDLASSAEVPDRFSQAAAFAEHAVGLLRGTVYQEGLGQSLVELADARENLGFIREASEAFWEAAETFRTSASVEWESTSFINAARTAINYDVTFYVDKLRRYVRAQPWQEDATLSDVFVALIDPLVTRAPIRSVIPVLGRHLHTLRENLPTIMRPHILGAAVDVLSEVRNGERLLHVGLVVPMLAKDNRRPATMSRLAELISRNCSRLDVRQIDDMYTWTISIGAESKITITVQTIDEDFQTAIAAMSVACFFRAFESEIAELVGETVIEEVVVDVASFGEMPESLRTMIVELGAGGALKDKHVAVTRPVDFSDPGPTVVMLGEEFLDHAVGGTSIGGSLQALLVETTAEIVYQLLGGQVNEDQIMPKIVSLVRRTLS